MGYARQRPLCVMRDGLCALRMTHYAWRITRPPYFFLAGELRYQVVDFGLSRASSSVFNLPELASVGRDLVFGPSWSMSQ